MSKGNTKMISSSNLTVHKVYEHNIDKDQIIARARYIDPLIIQKDFQNFITASLMLPCV